jgi:hypothetical protein
MLTASEVAGFVASALVLSTFAMNDMRLLRLTAIGSNIAFIIYATANDLLPILVLHVVLLPLNFVRLVQAERRAYAARDTDHKAIKMAKDALLLGEAMRSRPKSRSRPPQQS